MDERITVAVLAETVEGSLVLVVRPVGFGVPADAARGAFTVTMWREDAETVRMSLRSRSSGAVAYVQGGATLLEFVTELGWVRG